MNWTSATCPLVAAAAALAFSQLTIAADYVHPLLDPSTGATAYRLRLSEAVVVATGDEAASLRVKDYVVELEKLLATPAWYIRFVVHPRARDREMLAVLGLVSPYVFDFIPVCVQQHNTVVGTWHISSSGDVIPVPAILNREGSTLGACDSFIRAESTEMKRKINSRNAAQSEPAPAPK